MKKKYPAINLGAPGEEISKKELHQVINRFKNLHQARLQRVQDFLHPRQKMFLDILALVFHQNHAALPGFVNNNTPAGILDYKPTATTFQTCKKFFKNFRYRRKALVQYAIEGIYLMGSVGSIAFSKSSDMDIWLCHIDSLTEEQLENLQKKATAVEKWAESLGLEVHFFLMNAEQFRQGYDTPLSDESSGQTQHYLLLEEFYRTAIYIAGKAPAWWIVPPHQEQHYEAYIQHLLTGRFISRQEIIDFGGLQHVPADEFISATLWHIYKSLNSPYKSLLKLFLMECYASEYPHTQWIAAQMKKDIYRGNIDLNSLDPYLLIYQKVEDYLNLVLSEKRLSLSRQCFYLKIMGSSATALPPHERTLREAYLQKIATQWRWPEDLLETISRRKSWDIYKATHEHIIIRNQLKQCLNMIVRFAGQHTEKDYRKNQDLRLIGRKLHAFLEQKPGKIEFITTRHSVYIKESELTIIESDQDHSNPEWFLLSGPNTAENLLSSSPIKTTGSVAELLCWIVMNGLFHRQLKINIQSHSLSLSVTDITTTLHHLNDFITSYFRHKTDALDVYARPACLQTSLILVNLGQVISEETNSHGNILMGPRSDPFSYGNRQDCFILGSDQISISSWGEVSLIHREGIEGLFDSLITFINNCPEKDQQNFNCVCLTHLRGRSIQTRINRLYQSLIELFTQKPDSRFIVAAGRAYYLFKVSEGLLGYQKIENDELLLDQLASTQNHFSLVYFDQHVLEDTPVPLIYQSAKPDTITVFYQFKDSQTQVFIIDEKGALFTSSYAESNPQYIIRQFQIFLDSLIDQVRIPENISIEYFEIQSNSAGVCSCHPMTPTPLIGTSALEVRVSASDNGQQLTIYCNGQAFSDQNHDRIFSNVRNTILAARKNQNNYRCYITECDIPACLLGVDHINQAHTIHYLKYKDKIETYLSSS